MARILSIGSGRPVSECINVLRRAESAEERYRALTQIMLNGSFGEAFTASRASLEDADPVVRSLAAKQLGKLKRKQAETDSGVEWPPIVSHLEILLSDADTDVRFESALALSRIEPKAVTARETLLQLLSQDEAMPLMLAAIVAALTERTDIAADELVESYRKLLAHTQPDVRENVAIAVSQWGPEAQLLIAELITAIDDVEPVVRESAAIALGNTGLQSEEIRNALQSAANDEDVGVAEAARKSLEAFQA